MRVSIITVGAPTIQEADQQVATAIQNKTDQSPAYTFKDFAVSAYFGEGMHWRNIMFQSKLDEPKQVPLPVQQPVNMMEEGAKLPEIQPVPDEKIILPAPIPPPAQEIEFKSELPSVAICCYHSNIERIYKNDWIDVYRSSVIAMAKKYAKQGGRVHIFELNYGDDLLSIFKLTEEVENIPYSYLIKQFPNHVGVQNYLFDLVSKNKYDIIANTNVDDFYGDQRLVVQINDMIKKKLDICSCDYMIVNNFGTNQSFKEMHYELPELPAKLNRGENIIAHPAICIWAKTWEDIKPYDEPGFIADKANGKAPDEDLQLWKKALSLGKRFGISTHTDPLFYYRIHEWQVGRGKQK